MKQIFILAVCLYSLAVQDSHAQTPEHMLLFNEHSTPNEVSEWNWVVGDGELSLNKSRQLVLRTHCPTQHADNRVGAVVDLGHTDCESFALDVLIDPASNIRGAGYNSLDCGLTVGLPDEQSNPNRFRTNHDGLSLNIRDLSDRADYGVFWGGRDLSLPVPVNSGTGNPRAFFRHDGFYKFRMIVTPAEKGSLVRVYHSQLVTPDWEGVTPKRIAAGHIGIYARLGHQSTESIETTIASLSLRPLEPKIAKRRLTDAETVLYSLNLDYPGLEQVRAEIERSDIKAATKLFADYLRHRTNVVGPSVSAAPLSKKEQRIADLMVEDKVEVYTGGPLFEHTFGQPYDWAVDPYKTGGQFAIYNSRMFPWLYMGRAYRATQDANYSRTFVKQLNSWLDQIPLRIVAAPKAAPFFIDGNTLEPPLLFTGNMGRRIELTWWQAYELFKLSPEFDDETLMRMMRYFQENTRLVTNPSIFLAWDDSGLHMATGLLQCATMMPEWSESNEWKRIALERLEQTFRAQVHPDGTHASLSTGYGWATIDSYRNMFDIMKRNKLEIPPKFSKAIRGMIMGYMGILRPNFDNISLNDGGWGPVDDKVRESLPLFPDDPELSYFATRGSEGTAPNWTSRYFPNAGWYAMRSGFGPREKMLFMDGGPFGASHGKQDALHIVVASGDSLLLRDGGRGDYTRKPASRWSSQTLAFNTLTPDWAIQDRTHRYEHEKHIGRNPPSRPWITNNDFDYGRSEYNAGWYLNGRRIGGTHTRHVVFMKGLNSPATGYWIVVDQVTTTDDEFRTWRHPWHLSTENVAIDQAARAFTTNGPGAGLRILCVDPDDNVKVKLVKGQTEPVLQGWRVHGSESRPQIVPMHEWSTAGRYTKAWVLLPRANEKNLFEVTGISSVSKELDRLTFTLNRVDGGQDFIAVACQQDDHKLGTFADRDVNGRLAVIRINQESEVIAVLETE